MKRLVVLSSLIWVLIVALSFLWNYQILLYNKKKHAIEASRGFLNQIILTRLWNSEHGGVYAPVTETNLPNKYLITKDREIVSSSGKLYTKINPAYMTRQISEIAEKKSGFKFHITSLNPIRPQNRGDKTEKAILKSFENGVKEYAAFRKKNKTIDFFYMVPLITEKSCLKCHGSQGYKTGDIRGGISIVIPFIPKVNFLPVIIAHVLLGLAGTGSFFFFGFKLHRAYQTIKKQAVIDSLTKVPNRRSFSKKIINELKRNKREKCPLAVIMADIDDFKAYNDTYGHQYGDECLKKTASAIQASLKRPGDFCARYGGEEFIVILPGTHAKGAGFIAEEILKNIKKLKIKHSGSSTGFVTISLGIAVAEFDDDISHETLLANADKSMYKAKAKGKNKIVFFSEF